MKKWTLNTCLSTDKFFLKEELKGVVNIQRKGNQGEFRFRPTFTLNQQTLALRYIHYF